MTKPKIYIDEPGSFLHQIEVEPVPAKGDFIAYNGRTYEVTWREFKVQPQFGDRIILRVSETRESSLRNDGAFTTTASCVGPFLPEDEADR